MMTLKEKLAKRQLTIGSWLSIASPETAEISLLATRLTKLRLMAASCRFSRQPQTTS